MIVDQLMSRAVACCHARQTLAEAAHLMWQRDCGCIPVVAADDLLVGIITDRDICMAVCFKSRTADDIVVEEVMTRDVITCGIHDTVEKAEAAMRRAQVRRIPVIDRDGRVVGILSLNDLAREAEREARGAPADLPLSDVALTLSAVCRPRTLDGGHVTVA